MDNSAIFKLRSWLFLIASSHCRFPTLLRKVGTAGRGPGPGGRRRSFDTSPTSFGPTMRVAIR